MAGVERGGGRERWVRRVRGEGCWFMTMGYVYYQEPDRVVSQICYSSVQDFGKKDCWGEGVRGRGARGLSELSLDSQDNYFLHILSNDVGPGEIFHCPRGSTL